MAWTPTIGTPKPRNVLEKVPQLVGQQALPIPRADCIHDGLDFPVLEEVVDVPVEFLQSTAVTIQPRPQSPPCGPNVAVGSSVEKPLSHGPNLNHSVARYPHQEKIDSAELSY